MPPPNTNPTDPWDNALFGNVSHSMFKTTTPPPPPPPPAPSTSPTTSSQLPSTVVSPMLMKIGTFIVVIILFMGSFLFTRSTSTTFVAQDDLSEMAAIPAAVTSQEATSTPPEL